MTYFHHQPLDGKEETNYDMHCICKPCFYTIEIRKEHTLRMRTFSNGTPESGLIKSAKNCVETSMAWKNLFTIVYKSD